MKCKKSCAEGAEKIAKNKETKAHAMCQSDADLLKRHARKQTIEADSEVTRNQRKTSK
jgi:hypothetical protein